MRDEQKLEVIALAMKLRDSWQDMESAQLVEVIEALAKSGMFSIRQISAMCNRSPSSVSRVVKRDSKTGGKLNPEHLEMMRGLIFQNSLGQVDWHRVERIINNGTSPYVLARITGISRSTIHRKVTVGRLQPES